KPFWRFLQLFGASAFQPGFGPLKAAVSVSAMLRYLASTGIRNPSELLEADTRKDGEQIEDRAATVVLAAVRTASSGCRQNFVQGLGQAGFPVQRSLDMILTDPETANELLEFLANHLDIADALGDTEDRDTL